MEQQIKKTPLALIPPEFPSVLLHVWEWAIKLINTRGDGPVSYSEVKSWSELMRITLSGWEVDLIMQLDATYSGVVNSVRH